MPDAFGFETPQEAQMRVRDRFLESNRMVSALGRNATPGQQLGSALSNIFGGHVQKFIDTRAARKDYERQLIEQGLSPEAAKAQAKADIEPEFAEVRRAESMQGAASSSHELIANLTPEIGAQRAQAVGMLHMANRLRGLGMHNEATQLSVQADQILQEQEEKQADLESVKASTAKTVAEIGQVGRNSFMNLVDERERLFAKLATAQDPAEKESLQRQLGAIDAKIAKDTAVTGLTEFDLTTDKTFLRQQMTEVLDSEILNDQLQLALDANADIGAVEASLAGRLGAWGLGFMETTFAREPTESEKDFLNRVTKAKGGKSFVAAQVRHALTGAQMSAFEIGYLTPFLPSPEDGKSITAAKIKALMAYTSLGIDARMALIGGGRKSIEQFFDTQIKFAQTESRPAGTGGGKTETREERRRRLLGEP